MSNPPPALAPGWYDAGVPAQQRWWNGVEWTEHVRPTPYSEKWDRRGWGQNPEAMVAIAIACGVLFAGSLLIVLGFLLSGEYLGGIFAFLISLGLPTFAILAVISARIGFRRRRLSRPAEGESWR